MSDMPRREIMMLLGGAVAAGSVFWPLVARAEAWSKRPTIAWIAPCTREVGASFIESCVECESSDMSKDAVSTWSIDLPTATRRGCLPLPRRWSA
jgi:hypothetical protein